LKKERPWLKEVSSVNLQQALRYLDRAFQNFFSKSHRYPRFKKRGFEQSASYMKTAFTYKDGEITLSKQREPLKIRWSRRFKGDPTSLTISKDSSDRYYVSIHVKEKVAPLPFKKKKIGVDVGLIDLMTDDKGNKKQNPRFLGGALKQLRRRQKALSRKQKESQNRQKAKLKVARCHARIRDKRQDFLHKLSRQLVNENQVIVVENLRVKNMMRNRRLSRSIADASWSTLLRFLEYKTSWYGRGFVKVETFFPSSKRCSHCGYVLEYLALSTRHWTCPKCQETHDRDINAGKNLLEQGLKVP